MDLLCGHEESAKRAAACSSNDYQTDLRAAHATYSMSRAGNCWDNGVAQSFFAMLERERVHGADFATRADAGCAIDDFVANDSNCRRLHSSLGYLGPIESELRSRTRAA